MTYLGFLLLFLVLPIILFLAVLVSNWRKNVGHNLPGEKLSIGYSFLMMVFIALIYTTPWDNYLVAARIWWYDVSKVLGITLGWVPLEEYLFFILQPILVGLWMLLVHKYLPSSVQDENDSKMRSAMTLLISAVWIISILLLIFVGPSLQYLGLELAWALPAFILQAAYGGDILWRRRGLLLLTIVPLTLYLSLADAIAIQSGVWTINPAKSLNILVGGILPLEELVFFLLTNTLVAFGFTLIWSPESRSRLRNGWERLKRGSRMPAFSDEP